jgi:Flp pilus assembly protein TadG
MMRGSRARRISGSVMVEFTLSLTFLIPLFLGACTFGYGFYVYSRLQNAVRSGGRYASTLTYNSADTTPPDSYKAAVQKMAVYGDPAANTTTATAVAPNLTTSNVSLTVTFTNKAPSGVTVAIQNYTLPAYLGNVTLTNKPYAYFPFTGLWGPP